jgi:hypothetical protein
MRKKTKHKPKRPSYKRVVQSLLRYLRKECQHYHDLMLQLEREWSKIRTDFARKGIMFRIPVGNGGFPLSAYQISERVKAASELGYDVIIEHGKNGDLIISYGRSQVFRPNG